MILYTKTPLKQRRNLNIEDLNTGTPVQRSKTYYREKSINDLSKSFDAGQSKMPGRHLYEQALKRKQNQLKRNATYQELHEKKELKECSFKPSLNEKSIALAVRVPLALLIMFS